MPRVRQLVLTYICRCVDVRRFEYRQHKLIRFRTVVRVQRPFLINARLFIPYAVKERRVSFKNTFVLCLETYRVHLQRQCHNRVTAVHGFQRVDIDTLFRQNTVSELVEITFAHRLQYRYF